MTIVFIGSNRLLIDRPRSRRAANAAPDATNSSARRRNDLARPQRNTNSIAASDSRRTSINSDIARSVRNRNSAGARQASSIPRSNARLNSGRRQTSVAQTAQVNRRAPGRTERVRNNPNRNTRATTAPSRNREIRQAPARQRTVPQNRRAAPARSTAQR